MKSISILNDVLGPVMRGPSSSHTAGPYHIATIARSLLGEKPLSARFIFDPNGSFGEVYHLQGSDLGFAAGLAGLEMSDSSFLHAVELAAEKGIQITFHVEKLADANHPNTVDIQLMGTSGKELELRAISIGGGSVIINRLDDWPVSLNGGAFDALAVTNADQAKAVEQLLTGDNLFLDPADSNTRDGNICWQIHRTTPLSATARKQLMNLSQPVQLWETKPIFFVKAGQAIFSSAEEMLSLAKESGWSLGRTALEYEARLLGLEHDQIIKEILTRYNVMRSSVNQGLSEQVDPMLVEPCAGEIFQAEAAGRLALGGPNTRAAARAMAVMHVNASSGVICAAPTAGSAGVIPAVMVTLEELFEFNEEKAGLAVLAASAIGLILAMRASFAAEESGCQVEIGAAGAMGAAAVIEAAGGTPAQALNAAAVTFQNTMGWTCDPVQGFVEIPCHTRNAVAASDAFVVADLILGGYQNPVPLDETIDAVAQVGDLMPREIKCTALGGLSLAPSGLNMPCRRKNC